MLDGPEPIYLQLAQLIRGQVLSGEIADGERIASTNELSTTFGINPATAAKAFGLLVDEGVVVKRRGLGMYVADGARDRLRAGHRATFLAERLDPVLAEAALLGFTTAELVAHLEHRTPAPPTSTP